jgi:hypothetical protein
MFIGKKSSLENRETSMLISIVTTIKIFEKLYIGKIIWKKVMLV